MPGDHRILVTGASGFVGAWLQRALAEHTVGGGMVHPVGRDDLDIVDATAVGRLIADVRPTAVIHLAAVAAPVDARNRPREAWDVNVTGTFNLARATLDHAKGARFVFVGSADAYGQSFAGANGPIREDAALQPSSVYGATKAAADLMIGQMARDGLNAVRFRPFNHTGPGQSDAFVVPAFARQVAEIMAGQRQPLLMVGNLEPRRDFCDVRDIVRAYAAAALEGTPVPAGAVFNLASGRPRRIGDILDRLIAIAGMDIEVRVDPARLRGNEIASASGNAQAAADVLGWRPEIEFEQTLGDVIANWQARVRKSRSA